MQLRWRNVPMLIATLSTLAGCNGLLQSDEVPAGVSDPALAQTPAGALAAYQGAVRAFAIAFGSGGSGGRQQANAYSFVAVTGLITDELQAGASLGQPFNTLDPFIVADRHDFAETDDQLPTVQTYERLSLFRGQASQAVGMLTRYRPEDTALAGRLYALQGYAEVFLAELFCSGIPLSTLDFNGDYTLRPGSSTAQVFTHALALFDTATALAGDSVAYAMLARVGQGRALLGLGRYSDAAAAVATVPDDYSYKVSYAPGSVSDASDGDGSNFARVPTNSDNFNEWESSVADREALIGLNYSSSGDPRTATVLLVNNNGYGYPIYGFAAYNPDGSSPLAVANGVEARLIEAEAALDASPDDGNWLAKLTALRTDGTYDVTATSPPDTLWHAGSGGVAGLRPLADPGTADGRVDLLFRERAFWLFLTGHRQGDLRRLIRQYGRNPRDLYAHGSYPGNTAIFYGLDVTAPIPQRESDLNPNFTGCLSRSA